MPGLWEKHALTVGKRMTSQKVQIKRMATCHTLVMQSKSWGSVITILNCREKGQSAEFLSHGFLIIFLRRREGGGGAVKNIFTVEAGHSKMMKRQAELGSCENNFIK